MYIKPGAGKDMFDCCRKALSFFIIYCKFQTSFTFPSFSVLKKNSLKVFYHICAWPVLTVRLW